MSDAAAAPAVEAKKTTKKVTKTVKPAEHPPFGEMVMTAVRELKDRKGSSAQAIKKYVLTNFKVEEKSVSTYVRSAIKKSVSSGQLTQTKGTGANGSFKLGEVAKAKKATKSPAKKAAKSPAKKVTKTKSPAKKATKSPAKKVAKTTTKKTPTKSPKKSVKKATKSPKSPAKKPVAKKATKKPAAKKPAAKKTAAKK